MNVIYKDLQCEKMLKTQKTHVCVYNYHGNTFLLKRIEHPLCYTICLVKLLARYLAIGSGFRNHSIQPILFKTSNKKKFRALPVIISVNYIQDDSDCNM